MLILAVVALLVFRTFSTEAREDGDAAQPARIDIVLSDVDGNDLPAGSPVSPSALGCQLAAMSRTGKSVSAALRKSGPSSVHSSASSAWAKAM